MTTLLSRVRRGLGVEVERRATADQGVRTVDGVHGVADVSTDVERRVGGEVVLDRRPRSSCVAADRRSASVGVAEPVDARRCACGDLVGCSSLATTWIVLELSARPWSTSSFWAVTESSVVGDSSSSVDRPVASSRNRPEAGDQRATTAVPTQTACAAAREIRVADPGPEAGLGRLRGAERRDARPEDPAAEDHQQRGQQGDHDQEGHRDADGVGPGRGRRSS